MKRILFIAYYYDPYPGVASKRISYWANNITAHSCSQTFSYKVITATEQTSESDAIIYVKDDNKGILPMIFRTDKGASWLASLNNFLMLHLKYNKYDTAIITGGPFLHFLCLKLLKRHGIKVFLDFRDPFAVNPRAKAKGFFLRLKLYVLKHIERYFIKNADRVITVNPYCAKLLSGYDESRKKFILIDNGYDERILDEIAATTRNHVDNKTINYVYAGSLYADRNPENFLKAISESNGCSFHHVGKESPFLLKYRENPKIKSHGFKNYVETLSFIAVMDVCMIFTSGFPFESTTKIFDYIALEKTIWIITEGEVRTGALHDITREYPNTVWSKNDVQDIRRVINKLSKSDDYQNVFDKKYIYSRKEGLRKLISQILTH